MNLYEAIFVRKSVHKYSMSELQPRELERIQAHFSSLPNLFGSLDTEIEILDNRKGSERAAGLFGVKAPYYLVFYSEEKPRYLMNVGYLMQQMALYLCTRGLGACLVEKMHLKKKQRVKNGKKAIAVLAFGRGKEPHTRKQSEAPVLPMEKICTFREQPRQWVRQMVDAARMAPSVKNKQPWRFIVYDNSIHIYTKGDSAAHMSWKDEMSFGAAFANLVVAGEELWLGLDLIRLEDIAQNLYRPQQYLLSVVLMS